MLLSTSAPIQMTSSGTVPNKSHAFPVLTAEMLEVPNHRHKRAHIPNALFPVPTGIHLLVAEYLNARGDIVTANFVADRSEATLDRARTAFLADAKTQGFGAPVVAGPTFFGSPRRIRNSQRDIVRWSVPGQATIAIQRLAKLPIDQDVREFLSALTSG